MNKSLLATGLIFFFIIAKISKAEERTALVIGNSSYKESALKNPVNDAKDIAAALEKNGFQIVSLLLNANRQEMEEAIDTFETALRKHGGVGLFYYAGHGIQGQDGGNYLIPVLGDNYLVR